MVYYTDQPVNKTLTAHEERLVRLACEEGLLLKELAYFTNRSTPSIRSSLARIRKKMNCSSLPRLIILYWSTKLEKIVELEMKESERQGQKKKSTEEKAGAARCT